MSFDLVPVFSESVELFLVQCCRIGEGLHVSDRRLFQAFRAFWRPVAPEAAHPALLGQFRVELPNEATNRAARNGPTGTAWRCEQTGLTSNKRETLYVLTGASQGEGSTLQTKTPEQPAGNVKAAAPA